ncbi:hypothetical protein SALLE_v1c10520 [Spiroplasma alleghenense]|uniref:Uncharacterized protein n=1 Tax=Spiroplasma alleghenense TaxID=216931 RepID=A0A345Z543_9MOLU|nr:hypothetical protein SALLE_v1c10520 [Spiroplasma alleghenense]
MTIKYLSNIIKVAYKREKEEIEMTRVVNLKSGGE